MKVTNTTKVMDYVAKNPHAGAKEISKATGVKVPYIYTVISKAKKKALPMTAITVDATKPKRKYTKRKKAVLTQNLSDMSWRITQGRSPMRMKQVADNVNQPAHYKVGGIETIDFIEAKKLGYNLGNVVKYITRADHKSNRKEDLLKAQWYLNRELKNLG
jgi:hypothetical protein